MINTVSVVTKLVPSVFRNKLMRLRWRASRQVFSSSVSIISQSDLFDAKWYVAQYPDVAASGIDPAEHYVRYGAAEKRNPSNKFDTRFYLKNNPDVARAGINPLQHYIEYGRLEGRLCKGRDGTVSIFGPLVSIVMPAFSVERYIGYSLDSITKQSYKDIEIIVVDDGSSDGTYEVACARAAKDRRIKVLRQANSGPGAARNKGVAAAHGQYLTFADSDDILPPTAIAKLVSTLERTGSDFVVGALTRLRYGKTVQPDDWVKEVHAEDREGIRIADFPDILKDVFVWNKMFKSEFFHEKIGRFPEGVLYEDQEPTALAYLHGTFDVLSDIVYHWRVREDGTSITQNKTDINDLRDRLLAKQRVSYILKKAAPKVYDFWLAKAMGFDLRPYFEQVPRTKIEFFKQLRECMENLAVQMTPELWSKVRMIDRLPALAVLAGFRDDVGVAIARRQQYGYFVPSKIYAGSVYLDRKYLDGMQLSPIDELLKLGPADLLHVAKVTCMQWQESRLHIEGFAHIASVEFGDDFWISAELVADGREPVELKVSLIEAPLVDIESRDAWNSQSKSGFIVDICPVLLELDAEAIWRMYITIGSARLNESCRAVLRDVDTRGIPDIETMSAVAGEIRWVAGFERGRGFVIKARPVAVVRAVAVRTDNEMISITTEGSVDRLRFRNKRHGENIDVMGSKVGNGQTTFCCRLPEVSAGDARERLWQVYADIDGELQVLEFSSDVDSLREGSPEGQRVHAIMGKGGELKFVQTCWQAVTEEVTISAGKIIFRGKAELPENATLSARLVGDTQVLSAERVDFNPHNQWFEVHVTFDSLVESRMCAEGSGYEYEASVKTKSEEQSVSDLRPALLHGFSLRISVTLEGTVSQLWVKVSHRFRRQMPFEGMASRYRIRCVATSKGALWINFGPPYANNERGRYWQRRMHAELWPVRKVDEGMQEVNLKDAVLFESFGGKQISDSVLAICNEIARRDMGLQLYWSVTDMSMPIPVGTKPLLVHSREWSERLRDSRYLVNNNNFPAHFRKSPGQLYLQTWHGTPLKRIGNDIPSTGLSILYRQLMSREAQFWDYLLAQNDFAENTLRQAFSYEGAVVNLGYPRNDALTGLNAGLQRRMVRRMLGVEPHHFAVLYAPTWRDNMLDARGYKRVEYLDFKRIRQILGGHVKIFARGHHNTSRNAGGHHDDVIDVTHYYDINDLLLASDLLITDYSSVMFDYVVTGKPIIYLTPDFEEYEGQTRGFYLDFKEIAPGPICLSNDELVHVLSHMGAMIDEFSDRYQAFVRRFAPRDDGGAAARVVDAVWGRH